MQTRTNFSTQLLYTGFIRVGTEWCYKNIISPFSRLYIITKGEGAIYMNKKKFTLEPGDLFMIPKFTSHTYECNEFLEQYYVCFFDEMIGGRSIFDCTEIRYKLKASDLDYLLMARFVKLNETRYLPFIDPKKYDNKKENLPFNKPFSNDNIACEIESNGILLQLFSRFIINYNANSIYVAHNSYNRLTSVLNYINNNLDKTITIQNLALLMYITPDHFSRIFKKIMGISPNQYIQGKRVERAQTLLLTSQLSIQEIAEIVGVPNLSQFSTLFTKITKCSPRKYLEIQFGTLKRTAITP